MSDYISFDVQAEIMKRLPVRSLIRFRSVSKPWKTLIQSSEIITDYYFHNTQQRQQQQKHLLIRYVGPQDIETKYVSIVDDDTFQLHKYSITLPVSVKLHNRQIIVSSQGLICLYNFNGNPSITQTKTAVIWNPLISKSVDIEVPNVLDSPYQTVVGFGVCPKSNDIMLVKITYFCNEEDFDEDFDNIDSFPWQVNVFTLSSGVWRRPLCSKLPRNSIELTPNQVDVDRFLYWHAHDTIIVDDELKWYNLIMSFDMISEEFTEVFLPNSCLAYDLNIHLAISKLRESLVLFEKKTEVEKRVCNVWIMEHGDSRFFTKLLTVNMTDESIKDVLGFRMSGELVIVMKKNDSNDRLIALFVYEPYLKNINYIDIYGKGFWLSASSYKETLLLLDR